MTPDVSLGTPFRLPETDLAIVHALQVEARAPWARVAAAIEVDAGTVVRRWEQLNQHGMAWLTVWPTPERWAGVTDAAVVRVTPAPADHDSVVRALCALPWVVNLDETAQGLAALAVGGPGLALLGAKIRSEISLLPGVQRVENWYLSSVLREDGGWRLRVLSERQQRILSDSRAPESTGVPRPVPAEQAERVLRLLREDVRMPIGRIAEELGLSPTTAGRLIDRLTRSAHLRFGCDVALPAAGLGRGAMLFLETDDPFTVARAAARHPAVHRAFTLASRASVAVSCRFHSLTVLPEIEQQIFDAAAADSPRMRFVRVEDRWPVVTSYKRNGRLLNQEGRSSGEVPVAW